MENNHGSIGAEGGILAHTVPQDVVTVSQRERVLDAIAACCAEKTYPATTIADIVARAGVSRRTFYKLFPNKRSCFEAGVKRFADEVAETVEAARVDEGPWLDTIAQTIGAVLGMLASKPTFTNLALVEAVGVEPTLINDYWKLVIDKLRVPRPEGKDRTQWERETRVAIGAAQVMIARQIAGGRTDELTNLLPDLVYIAVLPFVGREDALTQARLAG